MPTDLLIPLTGLALLDSTSFGTLLIPLWLMLAPGRLRPQRVLAYLATVGLYYLVLGIALLAGATWLADTFTGLLESPVAVWLQLALGVGLFALSFRIGRKPEAATPAEVGAVAERGNAVGGVPTAAATPTTATTTAAPTEPQRPGRAARWRARAMTAEGGGSLAALLGLGLAAVLVETASMLPYLSAIGLLTASGVDLATGATMLVGYCVVMILPALVLLAVRLVAYRWVRRPLERFETWMSRVAAETTSWIVGIMGVLLALNAIGRLGLEGVTLGF